MPTVNIPPRVRFALYLLAAVALQFVTYFADKNWFDEPEVRLVTGLASLLQVLAAAKTDLSQPPLEEVLNDEAREQLAAANDPNRELEPPAPQDPAADIRERNRREGISR